MKESRSLHELHSTWKLETFSSNYYTIYDIKEMLRHWVSTFYAFFSTPLLQPVLGSSLYLPSTSLFFPSSISYPLLFHSLTLFSQLLPGCSFITTISRWKPCSIRSSNLNASFLLPGSYFHSHCVLCWVKMKRGFGKLMDWRAGRVCED